MSRTPEPSTISSASRTVLKIEDDSAHGPDRSTIGRPYAWKRDVLFVVYVEISGHEVLLISARHATKHERRHYEEGR